MPKTRTLEFKTEPVVVEDPFEGIDPEKVVVTGVNTIVSKTEQGISVSVQIETEYEQ